MSRLERLAARPAEPLLVTNGVNVRYLTGFESSNCALLVEPRAARRRSTRISATSRQRSAVAEVEVVQTRRDVAGQSRERCSAGDGSGSRRRRSRLRNGRRSGLDGVELVPTRGLVEALRAIKDEDELAAIRRAAAISDRRLRGARARSGSSGAPRRTSPGGSSAPSASTGRRRSPSGRSSPRARTAPGRMPAQARRSSPRGRSSPSTWVASSTATAPTARGRSRPASFRRSSPRCTSSSARPSWTASRPCARVRRASRSTRHRGPRSPTAGLADAYGHGLGHGLGLEVHEAPTLRPESTSVLAVDNVVTVEPGLYLPGVGGCRIEDLVAVTTDGCEIMTHFTKDLLVVS